jgi:hypothetical protein
MFVIVIVNCMQYPIGFGITFNNHQTLCINAHHLLQTGQFLEATCQAVLLMLSVIAHFARQAI